MRAVLLVAVLVALSQTALVALVSAGSAVADDEVYSGTLTLCSARVKCAWVTGNGLKERCGSASHVKRAFCIGFAVAVAEVVSNMEYMVWRACFPDGVTGGQLRDVMTKFLDENPERLHDPGVNLAAEAFEEAFPCPQ